jgi:hypothetical protein
MLRVQVAPGPYAPGDTVRGQVVVDQDVSARQLLVSLRYVEKSPDYEECAVEVAAGPLAQGDLRTGATVDFALELPSDALPGYVSGHGSLRWEVDAWIDKRGLDPHARVEFQVTAGAHTD